MRVTQKDIDEAVVVRKVNVEPTVFKKGCVDVFFKTSFGGKQIWQYTLWKGIIGRCFYEPLRQKNPTYSEVSVCDEWLSFGNFLEWVNKEVGYKGKPDGMEIDKDILVKGNKYYSPSTCCFVPTAVNLLLTDRINHRGEWPVGVCLNKDRNKFQAQLSISGKLKGLGCFDTPEEAFLAYKIAKEAQIKAVANQYKDVLKPAVYESLMNWEITP